MRLSKFIIHVHCINGLKYGAQLYYLPDYTYLCIWNHNQVIYSIEKSQCQTDNNYTYYNKWYSIPKYKIIDMPTIPTRPTIIANETTNSTIGFKAPHYNLHIESYNRPKIIGDHLNRLYQARSHVYSFTPEFSHEPFQINYNIALGYQSIPNDHKVEFKHPFQFYPNAILSKRSERRCDERYNHIGCYYWLRHL